MHRPLSSDKMRFTDFVATDSQSNPFLPDKKNNTAQLKTGKWFSFPSHFSFFTLLKLLFKCRFVALTKGITPNICKLCLVQINSVLLNLSCVWISFPFHQIPTVQLQAHSAMAYSLVFQKTYAFGSKSLILSTPSFSFYSANK